MKKSMKKILTTITLLTLALMISSAFTVISTSAQTTTTTGSQTSTGTIVPTDYGNLMQYEWPSSGQNSGRTRFSAGPGPNSASVAWQTPLSGSGTVTTWKGYAYCVSLRSNIASAPLTPPYPTPGATVYKFDALTGKMIWNSTEPLPTYIFYPAVDVINDNYLVLTAATGLVGMSTANGQVVWTLDGIYPTLGPGAGRYFPSLWVPELNEIVVRAQTLQGTNGYITAYDLGDGSKAPTMKWQYPYAEPVELQAYGNGVIFVGDSTWSMFGLNATNGQLMWYKPIQEQLYFSGIYANGKFYTGGSDRYLYAVDSLTGNIDFTHDYGDFGFVAQGGAFGYGRYYTQFINYTGLYISCIDGSTGQELWSYGIPLYQGVSEAYIQPAIADGKVWVQVYPGTRGAGQSAAANLACFDAFTGKLLYKIQTTSATPTLAYGNLYIFGGGYIAAYGSSPQDWGNWRGPTGTGVATAQQGPINLNQRWSYQTGGAITGPVVAAKGMVYAGSYDHNIYALDAYSGSLVWKFTTGYRVYSSPTVVNGVVYTGADDGNVYALDANTGAVIWKTLLTTKVDQVFGGGLQLRSNPRVDGSSLFVGSLDGNVYSLNIASGAVQWKVSTGGPIAGSPAVDNGNVFIGSTDRYIYSLKESDGTVNWKYLTPRGTNQSIGLEVGFYATPCVAQGLVFSGVNYDYKSAGADYIVALNESTGTKVWSVISDSGLVGSFFEYNAPVYYNGAIIMPDGEFLMAFNATTGAAFPNRAYIGHETLSSYVLADGGTGGAKLYMGTSLYVEYSFNVTNPANMTKLGFYTTAAQVGSTAAIYNGQIYVGSGDWSIYALGDNSQQTTIIAAGTTSSSVDLGKTVTVAGALTGTADVLSDGAYEGGHGGIPNAIVTVSFRGPNGEAVDLNTTTDNSGVFTATYTPISGGSWHAIAFWNGLTLKTYGYQSSEGSPITFTVNTGTTATPTPTPSASTNPTPTPSTSTNPTPTATTNPTASPPASSSSSNTTTYIIVAAVVIIVIIAAAAVALRRKK